MLNIIYIRYCSDFEYVCTVIASVAMRAHFYITRVYPKVAEMEAAPPYSSKLSISVPPPKRHTERCFCNNHLLSPLTGFCANNPAYLVFCSHLQLHRYAFQFSTTLPMIILSSVRTKQFRIKAYGTKFMSICFSIPLLQYPSSGSNVPNFERLHKLPEYLSLQKASNHLQDTL